jgi:hypothetical protein
VLTLTNIRIRTVEVLLLVIILSFVTTTKCLYIACLKISRDISEDILYVISTVEMNELRDVPVPL